MATIDEKLSVLFKMAKEFMDGIISEFGEERFESMCSLFEEFYNLAQEHQKRL